MGRQEGRVLKRQPLRAMPALAGYTNEKQVTARGDSVLLISRGLLECSASVERGLASRSLHALTHAHQWPYLMPPPPTLATSWLGGLGLIERSAHRTSATHTCTTHLQLTSALCIAYLHGGESSTVQAQSHSLGTRVAPGRLGEWRSSMQFPSQPPSLISKIGAAALRRVST